jgi:hypothetical protein
MKNKVFRIMLRGHPEHLTQKLGNWSPPRGGEPRASRLQPASHPVSRSACPGPAPWGLPAASASASAIADIARVRPRFRRAESSPGTKSYGRKQELPVNPEPGVCRMGGAGEARHSMLPGQGVMTRFSAAAKRNSRPAAVRSAVVSLPPSGYLISAAYRETTVMTGGSNPGRQRSLVPFDARHIGSA